MDIFAKTVAVAQGNQGFSTFLENQVKSEMGGEASFLLMQGIDSTINGVEMSNFLSNYSQIAGVERDSAFFAYEIFTVIPNLSISVYPGNSIDEIGNWSYPGSGNIPVMPVTENYNDTSETQNTAYFSNLSTTTFSNQTDPTGEVIIVQPDPYFVPIDESTLKQIGGHNLYSILLDICEELEDQIDDEIQLLGTIAPILIEGFPPSIAINPEWHIVLVNLSNLLEEYEEECGDYGGGDEPCEEDNCDRDTRECREKLVATRVVNTSILNKFCPWALFGRQCLIEAHVNFIGLDGNDNPILIQPPLKYVQGKRKDMKKGRTLTVNLPMYKWQYCDGIHGDPYQMNFIGLHHDAGAKKTFNFGLDFTVGFIDLLGEIGVELDYGVERTIKDFNLSGDLIYYCDDANGNGTKYTTGVFDFWVKEIESCN